MSHSQPQRAVRRASAGRAARLSVAWLTVLLLGACQPSASPASLVVSTVEPLAAAPTSLPPATPTAAPTRPATPTAEATSPPTSVVTVSARAQVAEPVAPATFSGQRAYREVEHLANEIGSRVAGTPAHDRAADYLVERFEAAGLSAERQWFNFPAYDDRGSTLDVLAPTALALGAQTLTYSPAGQVEAPLVYVDLARSGDFEPAAVRGKIALAKRGEIRFSEKVANLSAVGAMAVVVFNNAPGNFSGSLVGRGELPAVSLSQEDGEKLLDLVQRGPTTVRVKVEAEVRERTAQNAIGTKPGGPRTVVIGGHYDSVSAGPGANDNASGTATILELAHVVAGRTYPFTVRFVGFGAEEVGLIGSRHYVSQLDQAGRAAILAMINLDMVGVGDRLSFGGDTELVDRAVGQAGLVGVPASRLRGDRGGSSSDHASFQAVGVPSLFVYRGEDPNYHTANDRAQHVAPEHLDVAGRIVLGLLDQLAAENP